MGRSARTLGLTAMAATLLTGALVMVGPAAPTSPSPRVQAASDDPDIVTLTPARLLDTRPGESTIDDEAAGIGRRTAGQVTELAVSGRGGVAADAQAAVLNIAAIKPDSRAFVTTFPCNGEPPTASSLNVSADNVRANGAFAQLSAAGTVCLFSSTGMHLVVDVVGYLSPDSPVVTLPPARLLETRSDEITVDGEQQGIGTLDAGEELKLLPLGRGGVDADAEAVLLNIAAVGGASRAFVTVWPCGTEKPLAASLNIGVREAIANNLIARVGDGGAVCLSSSNSIHVIIDAVGFVPAGSGTTTLKPARLLDTRPGEMTIDGEFAGIGTPAGGATTPLTVAGRGGVDDDAEAVVLNVAAANPSKLTFVTVWPCGVDRPNAASLNIDAGAVSNGVVSRVGDDGQVCFFSPDEVDLIVDVTGWVAADDTTTTTTTSTTTTTTTTTTTVPDGEFAFSAGATVATSSPTPTSIGAQWPALDGATSYTVTVQPGGAQATVNAPSTSAIVEGLTADTAYDVSLTATDGSDTSPALESPQRTMPEPVMRSLVAEPLPPAGATTTADAASFLYDGPNAVQVNADPAAFTPERVGVVSGKIVDVGGAPLGGAEVSILEDGRLGHTVTNTDGLWDLAVNGGAEITVDVTKPGFLPSQRTVDIGWAEWTTIDDIALIQLDPEQTLVALDPSAPGTGFTSHSAAEANDSDGVRTARVLVRDGTQASLEFADGSSRPTETLTISVTEYTEGPMGEMAMPGSLPETSGYTYAVEATAAEAIAAGADGVSFDQPVLLLTDNFLDMPVGALIPIGTYSRALGQWETQPDGIVLAVVGESAGQVEIDADGDGDADSDDTDILDLDAAELTELAVHYDIGDEFWRGELMHFSPHDYNYRIVIDPVNPIPDIASIIGGNVRLSADMIDGSEVEDGYGTVDVENRVLVENIALVGTDQQLAYSSARAAGRGVEIDIPVSSASGDSIPTGATGQIHMKLTIAGRQFTESFPVAPGQSWNVVWDGTDKFGRAASGTQRAVASTSYEFPARYSTVLATPFFRERAGQFNLVPGLPDDLRTARTTTRRGISSTFFVTATETTNADAGLGGWSLSGVHAYDTNTATLVRGDGSRERVSEVPGQYGSIAPFVGNGQDTIPSVGATQPNCDAYGDPCGDGGLAIDAPIYSSATATHFDAAGNLLLLTDSSRRLRRVDAQTGVITTIGGDGSCLTHLGISCDPPASGPDPQVSVDPATCNDFFDPCGDGGLAVDAQFIAFDVQTGPDGSIYLLDAATQSVRKIDADGIISRVAGRGACISFRQFDDCTGVPDPADCTSQFDTCGDGGRAVDAVLGYPQSFTVGPDGTIYTGNTQRIRRITVDGIITTLSGTPSFCFDEASCGDEGPAELASWGNLRHMTVAADGSLLVSDDSLRVVRRITVDGRIERFAGNYHQGFGGSSACVDVDGWGMDSGGGEDLEPCAEGEHRLDADLPPIDAVEVDAEGAVYIGTGGFVGQCQDLLDEAAATGMDPEDLEPDFCSEGDWNNDGFFEDVRILRIGTDGIVERYAGNGFLGAFPQQGEFALTAALDLQDGFAIDDRGRIVWPTGVFGRQRVWMILDRVAPVESGERFVPDGGELHVFDQAGRHLRTEGLRSRAVLQTVQYDASGRLQSVTDRAGNVTSIQRLGDGTPTAVVSPYGDAHPLALDGVGRLTSVTNPAGDATTFAYSGVTELLTSVTGARPGSIFSFAYDATGRLDSATDPVDGTTTFVATEPMDDELLTTVTRPGGDTRTVHTEIVGAERVRTETSFDGIVTVTRIAGNGTRVVEAQDGTTTTTSFSGDPQYGGRMPYASRIVTTTDVRTRAVNVTRSVTLDGNNDVIAFSEMSGVSGDQVTTVHDLVARTVTSTSAEGLSATRQLDTLDRTIESTRDGLATITYQYDGNGRLSQASSADGVTTQTASFTWDGADLATATDPELGVSTFGYDPAGRMTSIDRHDGETVSLGLDEHGNPTSITLPSASIHGQTFDLRDRLTTHTVPDSGDGDARTTTVTIASDGTISSIDRADGESVTYTRTAGRLTARGGDGAAVAYSYDGTDGTLAQAAGDATVSLTYDGYLPTSVTTSGPVAGTTTYGYDNRFRVSTVTAGGVAATRTYDNDGRLLGVGDQTMTYDATTGELASRALDDVTVDYEFDDFGRASRTTATFDDGVTSNVLFDETLVRDGLGRVTGRTESVGAAPAVVWSYTYDSRGRLSAVTEGAASRTYGYDANDNLTSSPLGTSTYDARDRRLTSGTVSFDHDAAGDLVDLVDGSDTTTFSIDATSLLQSVTTPTGEVIDYEYDGFDRRVGREVDDVDDRGWIYGNGASPLVELDGSGAVSSRFVYGMNGLAPDYVDDGADQHLVITDWRGSPRLIVDAVAGTVTQRIDYDELGAIVSDTNPRFQPFGFQGGLVEPATGLVRFGARDYDPSIGRFVSSDPIGFGGSQVNLYVFADGDPINGSDPTGLGPDGPCPSNGGDTASGFLGNMSTFISVVAPFVPGGAGVQSGRAALGLDVASRGTGAAFGSGQPSHPDPIIAQSQSILNNVSTAAGVAGINGNPYAGAVGAGTALASKLTGTLGPPFYPVADAVGEAVYGGPSEGGGYNASDANRTSPSAPFIGCKL